MAMIMKVVQQLSSSRSKKRVKNQPGEQLGRLVAVPYRFFAFQNVCEVKLETCCVSPTENGLELTLILYMKDLRS
jgi:hypothetical protein